MGYNGWQMEVLAPDVVEDLFRVAAVQTANRRVALQLVAEAVLELEARSSQWRNQWHRFLGAVRLVSERWS